MSAEHDSSSHGARLWWALLTGCVLALPIGWLLATLVMLPFFLGLFFCMLFGLLLGAAVFRVGKPAAPVSGPKLWLMGLTIALVVWCVALTSEYYNVRGYRVISYGDRGLTVYPVNGDVMNTVRQSFSYRSFTPEELDEMRVAIRRHFVNFLDENYPPGGIPGYVQWAATDGTMTCPRVINDSDMPFKLRHRGTLWIVREALTFILVAGAITSQLLGLVARRAIRHTGGHANTSTAPDERPEQSSGEDTKPSEPDSTA